MNAEHWWHSHSSCWVSVRASVCTFVAAIVGRELASLRVMRTANEWPLKYGMFHKFENLPAFCERCWANFQNMKQKYTHVLYNSPLTKTSHFSSLYNHKWKCILRVCVWWRPASALGRRHSCIDLCFYLGHMQKCSCFHSSIDNNNNVAMCINFFMV